jgi:HPt (histidine-containing phosphotransfer) domain-containing protein
VQAPFVAGAAGPAGLAQHRIPAQSRLDELDRMQQALARGDAAQVASGAHKLHGSLAMYGFDAASALAAGIEQCAHTDLTQAQVLLRDLHSHLALQHKALP